LSSNSIQITNSSVSGSEVLFGAIWFSTPENALKSISTFPREIETDTIAKSVMELVNANIGADVFVKLYGYEQAIDAKIYSVNTDFVIFESKGKWISTNFAQIQTVEFKSKPKFTYKLKSTKKIFQIEVLNSNSKQPVDLFYMQKGITWSPNYYLKLIDDKKARLTLQALLINDIEDIKNTKLNFVVGVPSFEFSYVNSPIVSFQTMNEFINSLNNKYSSTNSYYANSNLMAQTRFDNSESISEPLNIIPDGENSNEGLFFYKKENITLPKGGRAFYDIFETEIDYEQIYSVDIETNQKTSYYYSKPEKEEKKNKVWQSIKFKNNTKIPFTTGSIFVIKKSDGEYKPISQNTIFYTPVGLDATIKTTISPDIYVTDSEFEIERKENAIKNFDLITIESIISINNYKDRDIDLNINRLITGELIKCDETWKTTSQLKADDGKNKDNKTKWDIKVKSGESKKITYTYKIFVAR